MLCRFEAKLGWKLTKTARAFLLRFHPTMQAGEHVSASRQNPNGMFLAQAPIFSEFLFFRYLNLQRHSHPLSDAAKKTPYSLPDQHDHRTRPNQIASLVIEALLRAGIHDISRRIQRRIGDTIPCPILDTGKLE